MIGILIVTKLSIGAVVIRSDTKAPGDLINTQFRENFKIVAPYSIPFPASENKLDLIAPKIRKNSIGANKSTK